MATTNEQNQAASKATRVHIQTETPANSDDLWSTAGKGGRPPLPAQPDPHPIDGRPTGDPMDPPLTAGQIAKMEADTAAERAEPSRKPGRPRGSRTRKPADNVDPRVDPAPSPPPCIDPRSLPGDLLWLALESFAGDIETEIVHRNPENVRHAASLILRLLSIAGA